MSTCAEQFDMKTLCVFCFAEGSNSSTEVRREEYWPYIQPLQWKGNSPPQYPPMCTVCSEKIEEIVKCHREIVKLEQKLCMVRKQLDEAAKDVRERMEKYKSDQKIVSSREKRSGVKRKRSYDEMMASSSTAANSNESKEIDIKAVLETDEDFQFKEEFLMEESEDYDYGLPEPEPLQDLEDPLEELDSRKYANSSSQNVDDEETTPEIVKKSGNSKAVTDLNPVSNQPEISKKRIGYCVICGKKLRLKYLQDHMKCHVGNYAYQCQNCLITFPSPLSFSFFHYSHQRRCKIKPIFPCEICGEELKYNEALGHLHHHETLAKNFTCPIPSCEKAFTWKQSLELHLGEHEQIVIRTPSKANPCEICGLPVTQNMHEHIVSHVGEFAFQCPIPQCRRTFASKYSEACKQKGSCEWTPPKICEECEEDFDGLQYLRGHLRRHETSEKNFTCPIPTCEKGFTVKQSLEFHLGSHAFRRQLQSCTTCPKRKKASKKMTPNEMEAHLKDKHGIQNVVKCENCTFIFPNQDDLVGHLSVHVRSGLKCHLCSSSNKQKYFSGEKLRDHYFREHEIGRRYLCESCDFSTGCIETLQDHKIKIHGAKGRRKVYKCELCVDKPTFSASEVLTTHNITLHGGEKLKCNFCTETFTAKTTRDKHEKYTHRGVERPQFTCAECDISFMTQISLKNHMDRIHLNKTFPCNECEKSFHTNDQLRRHVRLDHEGVRCVCETCGKSYKGKKQLEIHMRIHTGERPYLCKLCGLTFRQHGSWYNHTKKGHERKGDKFVPKGTFDRTEKRKMKD